MLLYAHNLLCPPAATATHADLYAIIKTTEKLERAYVRDIISAQDYEPACQKLIAQLTTLWGGMRQTVRRAWQLTAAPAPPPPARAAPALLGAALPPPGAHAARSLRAAAAP